MAKAIPGAIENVARDHISALKGLAKPYVEDFNKGLQGMARADASPTRDRSSPEKRNELKINDDETMEPIHGPQIMQGGKPGDHPQQGVERPQEEVRQACQGQESRNGRTLDLSGQSD